jgi:hypothetical protein
VILEKEKTRRLSDIVCSEFFKAVSFCLLFLYLGRYVYAQIKILKPGFGDFKICSTIEDNNKIV